MKENSTYFEQKRPILVVDACMGKGKTSAAMNYMIENCKNRPFLYITPFLKEVDRICDRCNFTQSDGNTSNKSSELKDLMRRRRNIAATHSLYYLIDREALAIARQEGYSLIVDENIQVVNHLNINKCDVDVILQQYTEEDDDGFLTWSNPYYTGMFSDYKAMADANSLYHLDSTFLRIMHPNFLLSFDEVIMLTYMFDGQYQKAYFDFFGFDYKVVGVDQDEFGFCFSDRPGNTEHDDYTNLIKIINEPKLNKVGDEKFALSKSWFTKRKYNDSDSKQLRNNLVTFFRNRTKGNVETRLWTTFKDSKCKILEKGSNRYSRSFLQISTRATNEYINKTDIAYLANRFVDPNLSKFFAKQNITVSNDVFALSEMLQWIFRSAIREGNPINLYMPSRRMRELLVKWLNNGEEVTTEVESKPKKKVLRRQNVLA